MTGCELISSGCQCSQVTLGAGPKPALIYYWDGEKLTGKEWQKALGTKRIAWDIYLIYGAQSKWDKMLPAPDFWMHQLGGETTAPTLDEAAFEAKLKEILNQTKR
jgi:hypothetical protein